MFPKILKALLLAFVALACVEHGTAQAADPTDADPRRFDATNFGSFVSVAPNWLFSVGDNPAWASPGFDDSHWRTISTEKTLPDSGVRDISYAWYRIHIHLRPGTRNLAVAMDDVNGGYEVFANGVRIGGQGPMKDVFRAGHGSLIAYPVTDSIIDSSGNLILAIRCALVGTAAGPARLSIRSLCTWWTRRRPLCL